MTILKKTLQISFKILLCLFCAYAELSNRFTLIVIFWNILHLCHLPLNDRKVVHLGFTLNQGRQEIKVL